MKKSKYLFLQLLWGTTLLSLAVWITYIGLTMPIVTLSHSAWLEADYFSDEHAGERELELASCVKVEPFTAGTCEQLPARYTTEWAE